MKAIALFVYMFDITIYIYIYIYGTNWIKINTHIFIFP